MHILQGGVDLRTALDEHEENLRRAKRSDGRRRRKGSIKPDVTAEIRPKRRAPVSKILLVGGATRMPSVPRFLENMTGIQPAAASIDPDQVSLSVSRPARLRMLWPFLPLSNE